MNCPKCGNKIEQGFDYIILAETGRPFCAYCDRKKQINFDTITISFNNCNHNKPIIVTFKWFIFWFKYQWCAKCDKRSVKVSLRKPDSKFDYFGEC